MNILILGSSGFIGNAVFLALVNEHNITLASRKNTSTYPNWKQVDFEKENDWESLLENIELVINCIGIIEGDFAQIQVTAPIALYKECIKKDIAIIHISALGAEVEKPISAFLQSKKTTDDYLLNYTKAKVIYPGIVLGSRGKSSQFLAEIADFPIVPLVKMEALAFIHITQLTENIKAIIANFDNSSQQLFLYGKKESLAEILTKIKGKKLKIIQLPQQVFLILFKIFPKLSIGIFNKATFMLSQENLLENHQTTISKASKYIKANEIKPSHTFINLFVLLAISFIWIWSGISSLISWDKSMELMKEIGANNQLAVIAIYTGSIIDVILGITVLNKKTRKVSLLFQFLIIFSYMLLLSIFAPHYWLHPFGILSKNIPLIVLSYYLYLENTSFAK